MAEFHGYAGERFARLWGTRCDEYYPLSAPDQLLAHSTALVATRMAQGSASGRGRRRDSRGIGLCPDARRFSERIHARTDIGALPTRHTTT